MTELLTTGEMIDRLKFGEVAETLNKDLKAYWITDVERNTKILQFGVSHENYNNEVAEYIQIEDQERQWRILPNYVSFAQAMKAVEEGKDVHCQYNGESIAIKSFNNKVNAVCFNNHCVAGGGAEIKIAWIVSGKWTIEGDE